MAQEIVQKSGFNEIVYRAVDSALNEMIGESGAKALKFYVDTSLIVKDPDYYSLQLRKIFNGSESGAQMLERRIAANLSKLVAERTDPKNVDQRNRARPDLAKESFNFRDSIEESRSSFLLA